MDKEREEEKKKNVGKKRKSDMDSIMTKEKTTRWKNDFFFWDTKDGKVTFNLNFYSRCLACYGHLSIDVELFLFLSFYLYFTL